MAFTDEDRQAMDNAAADAENELNGMSDSLEPENATITDATLAAVANWWKRWYPHAGHKRLARILLQYASKEGQQ